MSETIGKKIKKIRLMRGLHQADLQKLTGIHATWISRIENGRVVPTDDELKRIREALSWTSELDELWNSGVLFSIEAPLRLGTVGRKERR